MTTCFSCKIYQRCVSDEGSRHIFCDVAKHFRGPNSTACEAIKRRKRI